MSTGRCRVCGCTEDRACIDLFEQPCHWVKPPDPNGLGLCSACAPGEVGEGERNSALRPNP